MKRRDLVRHLLQSGCGLLREGERQSWWINARQSARTSVPRHTEIADRLARKICMDLGVDVPSELQFGGS
jgi:mRNA interferase HicA